jgi:hypothetical protein
MEAAEEGLSIDAWLQRIAEQHSQMRGHSSPRPGDPRPIGEVILENMKDVPAEAFEALPRDGASEHDHYLYGSRVTV